MRIIFLLIALAVTGAYGQTSKGNVTVGGSMSFQSSKFDYDDNTTVLFAEPSKTFTFSPNVGYFILDNWVAGITSSISAGKTETGAGGTTKTSSHLTGIFTRYYFRFGKFGAFPELTLRAGKSMLEFYQPPSGPFIAGGTYKSDATLVNAKAGVGLAWFVADNVSLEGILSYGSTRSKMDNDAIDTQNTLGLNLGLQFFIPIKK